MRFLSDFRDLLDGNESSFKGMTLYSLEDYPIEAEVVLSVSFLVVTFKTVITLTNNINYKMKY